MKSKPQGEVIGFRKIRGRVVPVYKSHSSPKNKGVSYGALAGGAAAVGAGIFAPAASVNILKKFSTNSKIAAVLGIAAISKGLASEAFDRYAHSLRLPRYKERRVKNGIASVTGVLGAAWGIKKIVGK